MFLTSAYSQFQPTDIIYMLFGDTYIHLWGFCGGLDGKESDCGAGDLGSIPGWRRFPGEENGYPLQYSCLENYMDRSLWQTTVYGVTKSEIQKLFHSSNRIIIKK